MTPQESIDTQPTKFACPCLTTSPGIHGRIKTDVEDFVVEEIPAYEPSGSGDHLFLWVEKRDLSGERLLDHLARQLGVHRDDIGMAGLKDRRAVTRQFVSVPGSVESRIEAINSDDVSVLRVTRHPHKLRTGHLKANHFHILLRNTEERPPTSTEIASAEAVMQEIAQVGFPNYYGDQRFGRDLETLQLGYKLLRGETRPSAIPRRRRRFLLRLALSSVQSDLFNQTLAKRIENQTFATVQNGDVMQVVESGGLFVSDDPTTDQPRLETGEIVITGPMFGPKMRMPEHEVAQLEQQVLDASGLTPAAFTEYRRLLPGTRRPFIIHPTDLSVSAGDTGLWFDFVLPKGCYATTLLREIQK
ncbi:MAG: tRNA pseudouridine(13) synthase TruD [Planctomycetota bacterium]|nr:tRNA pseudouridine(13) synthase TruD [Planctomycetota bacterium]